MIAKLWCWGFLPLRFVGLLVSVLLGLITQIVFFSGLSSCNKRRFVALWSHLMLWVLGVKLITQNNNHTNRPFNTASPAALYVSNHISWIDILALQASAPVVFVSKSEVKSWPVVGWLVAMAGTCFIDRTRRSTLRTVHAALTAHLKSGQSVCVFPEGTTTDGTQVLPFHSGLLQAAIDANAVVQPMRLDYSHQTAAYVGEATLLSSALAVLLTPRLHVRVHQLPTVLTQLDGTPLTRQAVAHAAYVLIAGVDAESLVMESHLNSNSNSNSKLNDNS
jgi:1-acyl-sn-glycerol-3-phosphate acyltransferase